MPKTKKTIDTLIQEQQWTMLGSSNPKQTVKDLYDIVKGRSRKGTEDRQAELLHGLRNIARALQLYVNAAVEAAKQKENTAGELVETLNLAEAFAKITKESQDYYQWRQRYAKDITMSPQKICEALDVTVRQQEESLVEVGSREVEKLMVGSDVVGHSKNSNNEKEGVQRTLMLLGLLERVNINIQDERQCYAVVGKLGQEEYTLICLPGLQYKILVCDKYANATFVRRDPKNQYKGGLTKKALQENREARRVIYTPQNIAGREKKILHFLQGSNAQQKRVGRQAKKKNDTRSVSGNIDNEGTMNFTTTINLLKKHRQQQVELEDGSSISLQQAIKENRYEEWCAVSKNVTGLPKSIEDFDWLFNIQRFNRKKERAIYDSELKIETIMNDGPWLAFVIDQLINGNYSRPIKDETMRQIMVAKAKQEEADKTLYIEWLQILKEGEKGDRYDFMYSLEKENSGLYAAWKEKNEEKIPDGKVLVFPASARDYKMFARRPKTMTPKEFGEKCKPYMVCHILENVLDTGVVMEAAVFDSLIKEKRWSRGMINKQKNVSAARRLPRAIQSMSDDDFQKMVACESVRAYAERVKGYNKNQSSDWRKLPETRHSFSPLIKGISPTILSGLFFGKREKKYSSLVGGNSSVWKKIVNKIRSGEKTVSKADLEQRVSETGKYTKE